MANKPRTFIIKNPIMKGDDVKEWQSDVKKLFRKMSIDCPIVIDGKWGQQSRAYTAALVHASGMSATTQMKDGVTPELRIKLRNNQKTAAQLKAFRSKARVDYRAKLRKQYAQAAARVHTPVAIIRADSWGFHPGVHDGLDVITDPDPVIFAMVKCKIVDVRSSGWWNKGAPSDPTIKAKGDGIIQMEVLENVGPFKIGQHIGYGHAEKALVKVGQVVEAGTPVGHAGFANAWHIHLMVNNGDTDRGIGTLDPLPFVNYAVKNG